MTARNLIWLCSLFYLLPGCAASTDDRALHAQQLAEQNCYDQYYAKLAEIDKSSAKSKAQMVEGLREMRLDENKSAELEQRGIEVMEGNARLAKELTYRVLKQCIQRVRN